jgi:hypothetical protein
MLGGNAARRSEESVVELPWRMKTLPVDARGYVVPKFVAWIDGKPDFRVSDGRHLVACVKRRVCWLCGQDLSARRMSFVVGPMCAVNRVSSEPPSHHECAVYAAKVCPFLTRPKAKRREAGLPEDGHEPGGVMIRRNPGVALVWSTKTYRPFEDGMGGVLFEMGPPVETQWFAEGREATRAEVLVSFECGLPELVKAAAGGGAAELAHLERSRLAALEHLPKEAAQ